MARKRVDASTPTALTPPPTSTDAGDTSPASPVASEPAPVDYSQPQWNRPTSQFDVLMSPANYAAYSKILHPAPPESPLVPLDKVEFRRPVEVKTGVFCQVLRFGQPVRTPGAPSSTEVFAWLDGGNVVLSTGQVLPLVGGLVELYVPGE